MAENKENKNKGKDWEEMKKAIKDSGVKTGYNQGLAEELTRQETEDNKGSGLPAAAPLPAVQSAGTDLVVEEENKDGVGERQPPQEETHGVGDQERETDTRKEERDKGKKTADKKREKEVTPGSLTSFIDEVIPKVDPMGIGVQLRVLDENMTLDLKQVVVMMRKKKLAGTDRLNLQVLTTGIIKWWFDFFKDDIDKLKR